ncbi:hypothetical protein AX774_g2332, partial [Zancudomyces culisetae]
MGKFINLIALGVIVTQDLNIASAFAIKDRLVKRQEYAYPNGSTETPVNIYNTASTWTTAGYPPAPTTTAEYPPAPTTTAEYPPAPTTTAGYPPAPTTTAGYPPAPTTTAGYPPAPT